MSVFDPSIRASMPQDPMIERPIEDTVTPNLISTVGKIAVEMGRSSAVKDLVGDGKMAAEAEGDASLLPTAGSSQAEQEAALNSIDTLSKLASARKAGLSIGQARTRATAILKRAVNENPLFADDVRKAYNNFFGGTGAGSIFELTAEEKALEKYKEDVTTRSLQLGQSTEQAALTIRQEESNRLRKQDLELRAQERTMNGDAYINYAELNVRENVDGLMREIVAKVRSGGALSAEDVQLYKSQARMLGNRLKREQGNLLRDENGKPTLDMVDSGSIKSANAFIDTEVSNMLSLLDDQSALKLSADAYGTLNNNFNSAVIKYYGKFKAVKDALGEQGAQLYFQKMLGNKKYAAVAQQDPFVQSILAAGKNFESEFVAATADALGNAAGDGSNVTDKTKAGWLGVLATDATKSSIKQMLTVEGNNVVQLTKDSVQASPLSLAVFNSDVWKRRLATDKSYLPVAEAAVAGAAKAARLKVLSDVDSFDLSGVRIEPYSQNYGTRRGDVIGIRVIGDELSSDAKAQIRDLYNTVSRNPVLWQGKADSAVDYVRSIVIGGQRAEEVPVEAPAKPTETRSPVTYTEAEQAMIPTFIEDSRRYQAGEVDKNYMMQTYSPEFVRKVLREYKGGN